MNHLDRRRFLASATLAGLSLGVSQTNALGETRPSRGTSKRDLDAAIARILELGKHDLGVAPEEGRFLHLLTRLTRARSVLEIGGCFGLGSLWLLLALAPAKGRLTTLEILPERVETARKHIAEFGFARCATLLAGDAHALVPTLRTRFDLVILNADKSGALDYFEKLNQGKLAPGAALAINGVVRAPEKLRPVVEAIAVHPDYDATAIQVMPEDGFLLACRRT